jgi:hypothetical protein
MALLGLTLKFGFDHLSSGQAESRCFTDFISRGATMVLEAQTFQYIVQDEAGETISGYTSTDEPPLQGDVITLQGLPSWESAEVVGVTMMLSKQYNMVVVKVRPANGYPL